MISIIVAVSRGGIIGAGGSMPWHIGEDLRMFRRVTTGHTVVMGRRTFESLGRALPNRVNVVVTRNPEWSAPGVETAHSLEEAMAGREDMFVIGGAELYAAALPLADKLYLTAIDADFEGDTRFPEWNRAEWRLTGSEKHERGETFPHPFAFEIYERKK